MSSSTSWISAGIKVLEKIQESQADSIERACRICAEAIGSGGLVHLFGTGHSRIPVEEMFPRYGSYPGFYPIVELSITLSTHGGGGKGERAGEVYRRHAGNPRNHPLQLLVRGEEAVLLL